MNPMPGQAAFPSSSSPTQATTEAFSVAELDNHFKSIRCLGHGASASAFLAESVSSGDVAASGRKVVLKMLDGDYNIDMEKELTVLRILAEPDKSGSYRDLSIVKLVHPVMNGPKVAGLVLQHVEGGTLAREIECLGQMPMSERRIAWYAYQLTQALAFCHERDVHHSDIKSENILIDQTQGGKLVLIDFGCAIRRYDTPTGYTEAYAAPELLKALKRGQRSHLDAVKLDAFSAGRVLLDCLCGGGPLDPSRVRLPWLEPNYMSTVGYSHPMKKLLDSLLDVNPQTRVAPDSLVKPLSEQAQSPLIADFLTAAQTTVPGEPVTMDNIQLGMFVQRGPNWEDGNEDGGPGSIGVITKLDSDARFCYVGWPVGGGQKPGYYRIGAEGRYELRVGPAILRDYVNAPNDPCTGFDIRVDSTAPLAYSMRYDGMLDVKVSREGLSIGQLVNPHCMITEVDAGRNKVFVAPTGKISIPPRNSLSPVMTPPTAGRRVPRSIPFPFAGHPLPEVVDHEERMSVSNLVWSSNGGLDSSEFAITSVIRVQSAALSKAYKDRYGEVALQNWGMANERRMFHGTGMSDPKRVIQGTMVMEEIFGNLRPHPAHLQSARRGVTETRAYSEEFNRAIALTESPVAAHEHAYEVESGFRQIVLCRVVLGRTLPFEDTGNCHEGSRRLVPVPKHSENRGDHWAVLKSSQVLPEYIITYKHAPLVRRQWKRHPASFPPRNVFAPRDGKTPPPADKTKQVAPPPASPSKMCLICMDNPVGIFLNCGHACFCKACGTEANLARLHRRCPECRAAITGATPFFGRMVED